MYFSIHPETTSIMARQFAWILAAALTCAPVSGVAAPAPECSATAVQDGKQKDSKQNEPRRPRFVKWWAEADHRAELGITDQQSAVIEQIFQAHLPAQRERYRELEKAEPALAKLIKEGTAEPSVVAREVERVEDLTAAVRKSRIMTLYRMQHELTAEQRAKLKLMDERRRERDRKSSDSGRHN
jgi:Spy/CpxP family protein refolding chaperone